MSLAKCGYLSRAAKTLMQQDAPLQSTPDVVEKLLKLHRQGEAVAPHQREDGGAWVTLDAAVVKSTVKRAQTGASPGASGWTAELLYASMTNPTVTREVTAMVKDILNGDVHEDVLKLLRIGRLVDPLWWENAW